ncbi:hypothetical protein [Nocardia mexicana]|uniref:Uncharacterized protein n=1 Tax=Nocardia mexicana TaxID=279262 RepID=A0A370GPX7_9NOCA|nr:hypothetical protein [Nocardia mexicana]RDI45306.1 hypothetical protein DFR68_11376 [Nocardia mexicana]
MSVDLGSYTARVRVQSGYIGAVADPGPDTAVVVVGYRAAFATHPRPGTPIAAFPGIDTAEVAAGGAAPVALIAVEIATQVVTPGISETRWEHDPFGIYGTTGFHWYLAPVDPTPGGFVLTAGSWAASGYEAALTTTLTRQAPTAPAVVRLHDKNPHTGTRRRWP